MERGMINFHAHTTHSDGDLIPAELIRRAEAAGLGGIGLSDHCDFSNIEQVLEAAITACRAERENSRAFRVAAGVEITHVHPEQIAELVDLARELGAEFVIVHGESPVEPVTPGTNRAAIEAGCDILAHPGFVTREDARAAAGRGVLLEISGRSGHSLGNGCVARAAMDAGCGLIFGSDTHAPEDIHGEDFAARALELAGLPRPEADRALGRSVEFMERILRRAEDGKERVPANA